ncbi:MAG: ATP-binding cassette subfamily F protein 3 [Pseudoalteromonas tetraodonis]|jgi:ATP-binding cassette subfamily F protein 3
MIDIRNVALLRGSKVLLKEASLRINPGDKYALVGANGTGKSSLFALLLNRLTLDEGDVTIPAAWRVVHMAQEVEASDRTAMEYVLDGHKAYRACEAKLAVCQDDLTAAKLHSELDDMRAWELPSIAQRLLQGLGFTPDKQDTQVKDFSGGWRIRLNLAQALMCPSDLLLLDEPTNHLDLDACLWLEQWLQKYQGTLLLISHDRDFIDAVCRGVVHLEHQQLFGYSGNYSAFERQRGERLAQQQQAFEKQQLEIAHMQKFVARFAAKASKAKQARSRVKALERMDMIAAAHVDSPFQFSFPQPERVSDPLLSVKHGALGYAGGEAVLNGVSLGIHPGSRIALLGANGQGKSTLVKTLAGEIKMLNGDLTKGEHLKIGYFSQHQLEALDLDASPMLQLQRVKPKVREQEIRNFLGSFDFKGPIAEGSIKHFSGGEKARLALALVVWAQPNLLLLDEPTNHLDLDMCHALTVALQAYEGAVVLISHDRHLVRNCADALYLVNEGLVTEFDGDLDDYRDFLLGRTDGAAPSKGKSKPKVNKAQQRKDAADARAKKTALTKSVKTLENKMEKIDVQLKQTEVLLADNDLYNAENKAKLTELLKQQAEQKSQAAQLEEQWLEAQEGLDVPAE